MMDLVLMLLAATALALVILSGIIVGYYWTSPILRHIAPLAFSYLGLVVATTVVALTERLSWPEITFRLALFGLGLWGLLWLFRYRVLPRIGQSIVKKVQEAEKNPNQEVP